MTGRNLPLLTARPSPMKPIRSACAICGGYLGATSCGPAARASPPGCYRLAWLDWPSTKARGRRIGDGHAGPRRGQKHRRSPGALHKALHRSLSRKSAAR